MPREELKDLVNTTNTFYGTFVQLGIKKNRIGHKLRTLLLEHITDSRNNYLATHVWFSYTREFKALKLEPGDRVEFVSKVVEYLKGYRGGYYGKKNYLANDFAFDHPTSVKVVLRSDNAIGGIYGSDVPRDNQENDRHTAY